MIALEDDLLDIFIKIFIERKAVEIDKNIQNFIKYLRLPIVVLVDQNKAFLKPNLIKQRRGYFRLIKSLSKNEFEKIYKKTNFKIILSKNKSNFPYVNINSDEFEVNFAATYAIRSNKNKLYKHLESLIESGDRIEIYDKYFLYDNGDRKNTDNNHYSIKFMKNILNNCNGIKFDIHCDNRNNRDSNRCEERIVYIKNQSNNVTFDHNSFSEHDRYIRIYKDNKLKYEIVLSSGIYNILNPNKDITYVIRMINQ